MIDGNSSKSGSHGAFSRSISTSGQSHCSQTNTLPGNEKDTQKWWYFLIPVIFFILVAKKSVQSYVGTILLPSSRDTNWAKFQSAESFATWAMDWRLPTFDLLNSCLNKPKQQSGENLVWPTGRNESVMLVCLLVNVHQIRFVFVLSAAILCVQVHIRLSQAMVFKEVDPADNSIGTFTAVTCFIGEEVDLPRKCFAVYSKHCTLPWCHKVDWTWLI